MHALYRNHMGNDLEVVNDARISFAACTEAQSWQEYQIPPEHRCQSANTSVAYIPQLSSQDRNLIGFLARGCRSGDWAANISLLTANDIECEEAEKIMAWAKRLPPHWTPFGQQTIKIRMKAPIPIRTQAFKHQVGFVANEESRRYIKSTPELFVPEFRSAPEGDIKQGSGGPHSARKSWEATYKRLCGDAIECYEAMIADGIAPEQARFILPQGIYVNWVWTGSLYAFAEFYNKRSDPHAQQEIRDLAEAVATIIEPLFPVSWKALTT